MAEDHEPDAGTTRRRTRRALLGAASTAGITSLAGCFLFDVRQSPDDEPTEPTEPAEPPPPPAPTSGYLTARTTTIVEELRWTATRYEPVMESYDDFVGELQQAIEVAQLSDQITTDHVERLDQQTTALETYVQEHLWRFPDVVDLVDPSSFVPYIRRAVQVGDADRAQEWLTRLDRYTRRALDRDSSPILDRRVGTLVSRYPLYSRLGAPYEETTRGADTALLASDGVIVDDGQATDPRLLFEAELAVSYRRAYLAYARDAWQAVGEPQIQGQPLAPIDVHGDIGRASPRAMFTPLAIETDRVAAVTVTAREFRPESEIGPRTYELRRLPEATAFVQQYRSAEAAQRALATLREAGTLRTPDAITDPRIGGQTWTGGAYPFRDDLLYIALRRDGPTIVIAGADTRPISDRSSGWINRLEWLYVVDQE